MKDTLNPQASPAMKIKTNTDASVYTAGWISPSNIALIKYWGKRGLQLAMNPSLSMSLSASYTETKVKATPSEDGKLTYEFYFDGNVKASFRPKLDLFFSRLPREFEFLNDYHLEIHSKNTFPHSTGIASSASAMSALALCISDLRQQIVQDLSNDHFYRTASLIARIGSGSACRSVYGGYVNWGSVEQLLDSSNEFGNVLQNIHPLFRNLQDSILIVSKEEKSVSSSVGHELMNGHPFAEQRFAQARMHHQEMLQILENGNFKAFAKICEAEALSLHAMMMTSKSSFILMMPESLSIIQMIKKYRENRGVNICFTLDAGPNVHLLYPEKDKEQIRKEFIHDILIQQHPNLTFLHDQTGEGPRKLN